MKDKIDNFVVKHNNLTTSLELKANRRVVEVFLEKKNIKPNNISFEEHRTIFIDWLTGTDPIELSRIAKSRIRYNADYKVTRCKVWILPFNSSKQPDPPNEFCKFLDTVSDKVYYWQVEIPIKFTHFTKEGVLEEFLNLNLEPLDNQLSDISIKNIIGFIERYSVSFVPHNPDINYFLLFQIEHDKLKKTFEIIKKHKRFPVKLPSTVVTEIRQKTYLNKITTVSLTESSKRFLDREWRQSEFLKALNKKKVPDKYNENPPDINNVYDNMIYLLYDYLWETKAKKWRVCDYCSKTFYPNRKDQKGCSSYHSELIKAKRARLRKNLNLS